MQADDDKKKRKGDGTSKATGTPGSRLRAAREKQAKSVDEISDDLRLDRDVILALEADDLDSLGAPVFVKGYLRSYARLLGMPENEVVEVLVVREPEPEEFRTFSTPRELKSGANFVNFLLWVALGLAALIGASYLLLGDEPQPLDEVDKGEFVAPQPAPDVAAIVPEPEPAAAIPDTDPGSPGGEPEPELVPEPVAELPVPVALTIEFAKECWVEVSDSRRRLVYGLEKAGSSVSVEGTPPFKLFLGNVQAVRLRVNEADFEVPGAGTNKNTARFVIAAEDIPRVAEQ